MTSTPRRGKPTNDGAGMKATAVRDAPVPPRKGNHHRLTPLRDLRDLWGHLELVRSLTERDLRIRYKQSWFGWAWALITPLVSTVLFTVLFKKIGHVKTGPAPYPLFAYLGLLPWGFFTGTFSSGSGSLIVNSPIVNKVYCPREAFVLSNLLVSGFDTCVSAVGLGVLFAIYRYPPKLTVWIVPLLCVLVAFTAGLTLAFAVLVVRLRDVGQLISIIISAGLFATPIAWSLNSLTPPRRLLFCALNPVAGVIDGLRRSILYGQPPQKGLLAASAITSLCWLVFGYLLFRQLEGSTADVL